MKVKIGLISVVLGGVVQAAISVVTSEAVLDTRSTVVVWSGPASMIDTLTPNNTVIFLR